MKGTTLFAFLFVLVLIGAAWFIRTSSAQMPPVIASHFDAQGVANGFSDRDAYTHFILLITVLVPGFIVFVSTVLPTVAPDRINIPNRDYWLSPHRRKTSLAFMTKHALVFGCALVIFLCAVHWQVVVANQHDPVRLDGSRFYPTLLGFLGFVIVWIAILPWRFRRP